MEKQLKVTIWLVAVLSVVMCVFAWIDVVQDSEARDRQLNTIAALCDWSINGDTDSERHLCGLLQEATNTEYICANDFNCWIETK